MNTEAQMGLSRDIRQSQISLLTYRLETLKYTVVVCIVARTAANKHLCYVKERSGLPQRLWIEYAKADFFLFFFSFNNESWGSLLSLYFSKALHGLS